MRFIYYFYQIKGFIHREGVHHVNKCQIITKQKSQHKYSGLNNFILTRCQHFIISDCLLDQTASILQQVSKAIYYLLSVISYILLRLYYRSNRAHTLLTPAGNLPKHTTHSSEQVIPSIFHSCQNIIHLSSQCMYSEVFFDPCFPYQSMSNKQLQQAGCRRHFEL